MAKVIDSSESLARPGYQAIVDELTHRSGSSALVARAALSHFSVTSKISFALLENKPFLD